MDEKSKSDIDKLVSKMKPGIPATSVELARNFLKNNPKSARVWLELGVIYTSLALYKKAKDAFEECQKYITKDKIHFLYSQLGHYYEQQGKLSMAEKYYLKSLRVKPDNPYDRIFLGALYSIQGNFSSAEKCFRKVIGLKNDVVDEAYLNLGYLQRARGEYKKALESFQKALAIDRQYSKAKEAIRDIKEALKVKNI